MPRAKRPAGPRKPNKEVEEQALFAGRCCLGKKAEDVQILDLRKVSDLADFFVVCEGYTDIHVRSVAEFVIDEVEKRFNSRPNHVEGMENGRWVLLDYFDYVVHVFQPEARRFYQLERLWGDAPARKIEDEPAAAAESKGE
ncbi:ribosome silencing factor [bacterium]|nr:ribosome silencing factor [bacterium]